MRAALALEMYSSSSFYLETMSFFSTRVLPVLDGIFQQIRESHRLKTKFQRKVSEDTV